MSSTSKSLAGPGYVILNILRIMNIIALLMVIMASWVMIVKTFIVSKFFFFDAVSHLVTSCVGLFLIVSEIQIFKGYFTRNWPLLAPSSGLVTLGCAMIVLGVSILGNLNKEATSQESLGFAFWRIVISGGILVAILGLLNIVASFIFRDRKNRISARQIRSKGAVADGMQTTLLPTTASSPGLPSRNVSQRSYFNNDDANGSSTMAERQASVRSVRQPLNPRLPLTISRPMNFNHQFSDYVHHTQQGEGAAGTAGANAQPMGAAPPTLSMPVPEPAVHRPVDNYSYHLYGEKV